MVMSEVACSLAAGAPEPVVLGSCTSAAGVGWGMPAQKPDPSATPSISKHTVYFHFKDAGCYERTASCDHRAGLEPDLQHAVCITLGGGVTKGMFQTGC